MQPYIKKFQPEKVSEIVGQEKPLEKIGKLLKNWKKGSKAIFIYGPTGVGKSIAAYVFAKELDLEFHEINASDIRNKEQIEQVIGSVIGQQSLFFRKKLILIDEIDGISGTKDRGGLPAITKLIENSSFPIIIIATNPWDYKFNKLRKKTELIEFSPLDYMAIFKILKNICGREKIRHEDDILKGLARRAGNDARSAVNDLQTLTIETNELTKKSLDELGDRNRLDTIINALLKIFKTTDPNIAIKAFDNVEEDLDKQLLWLDENLPREYTKAEDLAEAYDKLSKADVFQRRIRRWQHYRFLVYINALITAGIAVSKKEKYKHYVQYKPTGKLLKLWWAKQKSMKKRAIAEKIAEKTHSSAREVLKGSLPYIQVAFKKDKEFRKSLTEELELTKEEVGWMMK